MPIFPAQKGPVPEGRSHDVGDDRSSPPPNPKRPYHARGVEPRFRSHRFFPKLQIPPHGGEHNLS